MIFENPAREIDSKPVVDLELDEKNEDIDFEELESPLDNEQMRDLSQQASQDALCEKLKDLSECRERQLVNMGEDSPPRYHPKHVSMPEVDESQSEEDYEN
jgi:hypothetical protein